MRYIALSLFLFVLSLPTSLRADGIVDTTSKLEEISTDFGLADGPAWDGSWALYVPDVKGQKLYRYIPAKNQRQVVLPDAGRISASFYSHGKLFLSDNGERRISFLQDKQKVVIAALDPDAKPPAAPNDLVVDKHGGIYFTLTRQGTVVHIPRGGNAVVALKVDTPNGLILSPDGKTLYVASYVPKKIWAYDIDDKGAASNERIFASMDSGPDKGADGMAVDRGGNVYCAGPAHVWVWSPSGKLLTKIETPTRPINCAFGDRDMRSLYITCFGGLYRQWMNVYGLPPQPTALAEDHQGNTSRPVTTLPTNVDAHLDVVYAQAGDRRLLADIFVPNDKPGPHPAVVVVHGGGWLNGYKSKFRALAQSLAARGYVTAAIEYRLGYEAKFPAGIQDCNASVRFLRANAQKYNLDADRIGVVGGSAGAHLAGLMAAAPHVEELQGTSGNSGHSSRLQAAVIMAGPMQMATGSVAERSRKPDAKSNSNVWLGKTIDQAPELYRLAAPYQHLSKNTPPLLFMTGEFDNPARNEPTREKLKSLGVWTDIKVYKGGKHGCWNQLPWFADMVADMDAFFQQHLE